jgi:hypothetical protein
MTTYRTCSITIAGGCVGAPRTRIAFFPYSTSS